MYSSDTLNEFKIIKSDNPDKRLVAACVYAPNMPDADGEFMLPEAIEKMAHEFISNGKVRQIDVQHNNKVVKGASVVESFIARAGDNDFIEGSWVVAMKIDNDDVWAAIKKGEINGFSIEALVTKTPTTLEFDIPPVVQGLTTKSDDHEHTFFVAFDPQGKFCGGRTTVEKGHFHTIRAGTVTEKELGHNHRFSFVEKAYTTPEQLDTVIKAAAECEVFPITEVNPEVNTEVIKGDTAVTVPPVANASPQGINTPVKEGSKAVDKDCCKVCGKEPCACVADPKKEKSTKLDDFKLAIKESVIETLKAIGIVGASVEKSVVEDVPQPILKWDTSGDSTDTNYAICHKASNYHLEQATNLFRNYSEIQKSALTATEGKETMLSEAKVILALSKKHTTAATYAEEVCEAVIAKDTLSANTMFERYAEFNLGI